MDNNGRAPALIVAIRGYAATRVDAAFPAPPATRTMAPAWRTSMCLPSLSFRGVGREGVRGGCMPRGAQPVGPGPRPLGRALPVSQPPPLVPGEASLAREMREPTGVVTLAQAQALALVQN